MHNIILIQTKISVQSYQRYNTYMPHNTTL